MPTSYTTTRYWSGLRLLLVWSASLLGLALLRWVLRAGTYRALLEGHQVTRTAGYWPSEFATFVSVASAGIAAIVLVGLTVAWVRGRKERTALRTSARSGHRKVLM